MEREYKITIGLEIHAELKTNSKMFCGCKNDQEESEPNKNICPVCMALPGTLPVINKEAVRKVLLVGKSVGGNIANFTEFDRKNYFYPDIPKGYQISQYKHPLVSGGSLNGTDLARIHLEEDTAKSSHASGDYSLVDFNRAGLPLMELVTEPVIHSGQEAVSFAKELQLLLQYLNVSDANMEKGQMRVEVNISVSKTEEFGTKVEVKNINSFKAVEKAIDFEYKRQTDLLNKGEKVAQETRGFDENKQATFSQRSKENSKDYRYFPDPDLPKLFISEVEEWKNPLAFELPETPAQKRKRFEEQFGIKKEDIEVYINNVEMSRLFEETVLNFGGIKDSIQLLSNYITSDLIGLMKGDIESDKKIKNILPVSLAKMIEMNFKGDISSRATKDILKIIFDGGGDPETIANERGLIQKNDPELITKIMRPIVEANQGLVEEYRNGKESALQFFVGQGMKSMKGSGNPEMIKNSVIDIIFELGK